MIFRLRYCTEIICSDLHSPDTYTHPSNDPVSRIKCLQQLFSSKKSSEKSDECDADAREGWWWIKNSNDWFYQTSELGELSRMFSERISCSDRWRWNQSIYSRRDTKLAKNFSINSLPCSCIMIIFPSRWKNPSGFNILSSFKTSHNFRN